MGKPGGFLEFKREIHKEVIPQQRVRNWDEFRLPFDEDSLRTQAGRCMDCGTPFCHSGMLIAGVASGCPINNLIPEFNDLVWRGLWREAYQRLSMKNNFPEFTGRVCPAPCEGSCVLGIINPPVAIKDIECEIIDRAFNEGWVVPQPPKTRTGKRVAVVGSGPSGLACAAQLNMAGHNVTVFERADRPGGLLMYGIPNMKLDKKKVLRRIQILEEEGIIFQLGVEVGKNYSVDLLLKDHDAVVLCCGATKPRDLRIEGRNLSGIYFAVDYLSANTRSILEPNGPMVTVKDKNILAYGKEVVVIGGGDTGTDCVGTALRQGCKSVIQLEILPKPPETRQTDNPWPQWPKILKVDYGQEEAATIQGADPRQYCTTATKFEGDTHGHVKAVHTVKVQWVKDASGRYVAKQLPGTERVIPAQLVLIAMGFLGPEDNIPNQLGLDRDERSNIRAEYGKFLTNVKGVFAAGDARRGQSLVVWAINEGRAVARECDRYLMGRTFLP